MEFSSPEYWSGLPCPSSGDLPDPGIKPGSHALQADSFKSEPFGSRYLTFTLRKLVSITFRGNLIMFNYGMLTQIPFWLFNIQHFLKF